LVKNIYELSELIHLPLVTIITGLTTDFLVVNFKNSPLTYVNIVTQINVIYSLMQPSEHVKKFFELQKIRILFTIRNAAKKKELKFSKIINMVCNHLYV
jgi:hypothetical protein